MLLLKKKNEEAAAAAAAAAAATAAASSAAAAGGAVASAAAGGGSSAAAAISLRGGDERKVTGAYAGRKMKPGEIRIQKDISELDAGKAGKVTWPDPSDLTDMVLTVKPDTGLWAHATFTFSIKIPDMYPHDPPKVKCLTKVYHPNIDLEGAVCLNILREDWKPVLDINAVIYGIIFIFYEPNPADPLNMEASALMRDSPAVFESNVRSSLRGGTLRIEAKKGVFTAVSFPKLI